LRSTLEGEQAEERTSRGDISLTTFFFKDKSALDQKLKIPIDSKEKWTHSPTLFNMTTRSSAFPPSPFEQPYTNRKEHFREKVQTRKMQGPSL
jgi:hypothetical protein